MTQILRPSIRLRNTVYEQLYSIRESLGILEKSMERVLLSDKPYGVPGMAMEALFDKMVEELAKLQDRVIVAAIVVDKHADVAFSGKLSDKPEEDSGLVQAIDQSDGAYRDIACERGKGCGHTRRGVGRE